MIKFLIFISLLLFNYKYALCRNIGETEITTEDGIEVFQEEKYYLLKKNVQIVSDDFTLNGDLVEIHFEQDLYDIKKLIASNNVIFNSTEFNMKGKGDNLDFKIDDEIIAVNGIDSELFLETTKMYSDGKIIVNNFEGSFFIEGKNSKLISDNINITGYKINGIFDTVNGKKNISNLEVYDNNILSIQTEDTKMFSKKAFYDKKKSIIELFDDVQIIRGNEIISGDHGMLDTNKNFYKVTSKQSNKVKAIISNTK